MRTSRSIVFLAVLLLIGSAQAAWAQKAQFYDLGHYPGGTWAEPRDINDSGVVVGFGDISTGYTRPIGVPVFGPQAGHWFDLGTLGGDRTDSEVMCMAIANTGMIVGHAALPDGETIHAFAWTQQSGMVDIGTLADIGYSGYNFSLAYGVNKTGTLITGWSSSEFLGPDSLPVVWTPKVSWKSGRPVTTWKIHKLDTGDFGSATYWLASFANNSGQIIGTAAGPDGVQIAVLWNSLPGGEQWRIMRLPPLSDYPAATPLDINNKGEIVGDIATGDWSVYFPVLWRPADPSQTEHNLTVLRTLTGLMSGSADAEGINDLGDIVGGSLDAHGKYYATHWNTTDLSSAQMLRIPGAGWSWATKVNNNGIATGSYGKANIPENTVAWQVR